MSRKMLLPAAIFLCFFAAAAQAAEIATPKEVKAKVEKAAKLLSEKGASAFPALRDKKGEYVWKDSYLAVSDLKGKLLVHPIVRKLEGANMMRAKDANDDLFFAKMVRLARTAGKGWVAYWWVHPKTKKLTPKASYVVRVPGRDWLVLGGVWNMNKEQAEAASR